MSNLKNFKMNLNERLCFGGLSLLKKNLLLSNVIARKYITKLFGREGKMFIASKFERMRQVLSTFKESWKVFLAVAAVLSLQLISAGQLRLCGAILIGALLNFFYFLSTAARLEAAANSPAPQAKKIMLIGLLFRLAMVFAVLAVAVHISTELFLASAVSFGVFYLTALFVLARSEVRKKF